MKILEPFHEGERATQERAGATLEASRNGGLITSAVHPKAIPFIEQQSWVILGGTDFMDRLWCSAIVGNTGFSTVSMDGKDVHLDLGQAPSHPGNPLLAAWVDQARIGALFIDLTTRRRLRVNGRITSSTSEHLRIAVEEFFPNCPNYIQKRTFHYTRNQRPEPRDASTGTGLRGVDQSRILTSDTMFLATIHPERGLDASHRGGNPGFVEVLNDSILRLPDYPGNRIFSSLGNLAVDSRMGVLFPNFDNGELLHLSGTARVVWDAQDPKGLSGGTNRFLEFLPDSWVLTPPAVGAPKWVFVEASPFNV